MKEGWIIAMFMIGFVFGAMIVSMTPSLVVVHGKTNSAMTIEYKDVVYRLTPLETP